MELAFLDALQKIHTPLLDQIMISITKLGNGNILWILLGLFFLIFTRKKKTGILILLALLTDILLCNHVLKTIVARPRPFTVNPDVVLLIPAPAGWSFPSGHTSAAFACTSILFFTHVLRFFDFVTY